MGASASASVGIFRHFCHSCCHGSAGGTKIASEVEPTVTVTVTARAVPVTYLH